MNKNIYSIVFLCLLLIGMNYINAWTGPATSPAPTNPPNNNVPAPVNIGSTVQVKNGGLGVTNFAADSILSTGVVQSNTQMRSPQYCDQNGANCVTSSGVAGDISPGSNTMATMRASGYSVPTAPAGLAKGEWPEAIICEQGGTPYVLRLHQASSEVRYRDSSATRNYTFFANGNYSNRSDIMGGCSVFSAGGNLTQICDAGLCIY